MRTTPENITTLAPGEIFVFGSNTAGCHGGGAALWAYQAFEAEYGLGEGLSGQTYALPTVEDTENHGLKQMSLEQIGRYIDRFKLFAFQHGELTFLVTQIGCGIAGHTPAEIAPFFKDAPANCILPQAFHDILNA